MCNPKPGPRCDTHVLDRLIDKMGFARGSYSDENVELRCELLVTRGGLTALAQQITQTQDPQTRSLLLSAYKTGYVNFINKMELIGRVPRPIANHPQNLDDVVPLTNVRHLQRVAYNLYSRPDAPLYAKARRLEKRYTSVTSGYTPGQGQTSVLDTAKLAHAMNADLSNVPEDVVALDIECDTSHGFGLQPHRAQITEMVLCDKHRTVVFSGDEVHILAQFAQYANTLDHPVTFIGWNNSGYDDIFMAVRAGHHGSQLSDWNMSLSDAAQQTGYIPVGGYEKNQEMTWTTPSGITHHDQDIFATIKNSSVDTSGVLNLKGLSRYWGMNPIELDRAKMHQYTQEEREAYVASDGIATLFNYGQYLQKR